ncbi:MAG: M48 family metallopeptidase [Oscillospiraceae bacterium]|nr:M48 family metallopeptidase [Oscillospiraceae bacterium]
MPNMRNIMVIEGIPQEITVIRSTRKTLCIQLTRDGSLIARAPLRMKETQIRQFILSKASLLQRHLQKMEAENKALQDLPPFTNNEIQWMVAEAKKIIPDRVAYYASLLGISYGRITIRKQITKWGSCSAAGNLNFNCLLIKMPPQVLDAVVVHELCHILEMNHSKSFYRRINQIYPEYDRWMLWLKEHGNLLLRRFIAAKQQ